MTQPPPAIAVRNVRKTFQIHTQSATTLKEMVLKNLFAPGEVREYRALDDVSLTLEKGQSLAIIGGNGSGKSTLLKIIAGITDPDEGTVEVNGRVAALLELGAAFQPELTGMENIFLQCSVLGLPRETILERLDEILEFSGLDKFIHTPVKRYSSGMFMRLAFSIAAFIGADILLIDEVLSVGDSAFQMKCKQKLRELRREGKTILFVSHILEQVAAIADDILWLEKGQEFAYGPAEQVLPRFFAVMQGEEDKKREAVEVDLRTQAALPSARFIARRAIIESVTYRDEAGQPRSHFHRNEPFTIIVECTVTELLRELECTIALGTLDSVRAAWFESGMQFREVAPGRYFIEARVEKHHLRPALYLLSLKLGVPNNEDVVYDMHLRLYAVSIFDETIEPGLEKFELKLFPFGEFPSLTAK